jgi:hypothetical protein
VALRWCNVCGCVHAVDSGQEQVRPRLVHLFWVLPHPAQEEAQLYRTQAWLCHTAGCTAHICGARRGLVFVGTVSTASITTTVAAIAADADATSDAFK